MFIHCNKKQKKGNELEINKEWCYIMVVGGGASKLSKKVEELYGVKYSYLISITYAQLYVILNNKMK